jgi:hypothetical protein
VDDKINSISNWEDGPVHYRYITLDDVEEAGQKGQGLGKSFWQDHYKLMCGSIPEVVHTRTFDRSLQRRSQNVQIMYSYIARGCESPVTTQAQNNTPDDASVDTTAFSNLSRQGNSNILGLSVVTGLSIMKKCMEEIDKQSDEFMTKQQRMYASIISVTTVYSITVPPTQGSSRPPC